MANGHPPAATTLILSEIHDQNDMEFSKLRSLQALSRSLVAGVVSAALLAFISWPDDRPIGTDFARLAICILALLVLLGMLVEAGADRWHLTDIDDLIARLHQVGDLSHADALLEVALLITLNTDLKANQRLVRSVKRRAAVQTYATFAGGLLLFAVLLGLIEVT